MEKAYSEQRHRIISFKHMRKYFIAIALLICTTMSAQDFLIKGTVTDQKSGAVIELATIRLMKSDSTFVTGASTQQNGSFKFSLKKAGNYILKFSYIGYNSKYKNVSLTKDKPEVNLGAVALSQNDIVMEAATIKARIAKLEMHKDTFIYNVAAYKVPEGATLEALIDKLPGAVVDDNGGITINGKTVSEIRVDGKDFFKGDTKVAMKNLPVALIDKVKAYDMQSDYTKQTGIDDGNEKTVLDLEMKKKLKSAWSSNADLAYGNHERYSNNVFMNRFTDNTRITAFGSVNNVGDRRFRGGGPGFFGGGNGLSANKSMGLDGFWNNGKKDGEAGFFELGGNFKLNHTTTESLSRSNSETFLNTQSTSSFSNNSGHNYGKSSNANVEMFLRWNPDSMTSIYVRPSFNHSESNSNSDSKNVTFNSNPYKVTSNPLDSMFLSNDAMNVPVDLAAMAVNRNIRNSLNSNDNNNADASFSITRKLNSKGRSVSLDGDLGYSKGNNENFNNSDIFYYQRKNNREVYTNQYTTSPSKSWNYSTRVSYSEPLLKELFLQTSYNFSYRYSDSDRSLYELDSLNNWGLGNLHALGSLPSVDSLNTALNVQNSQYATYRDYTHSFNIGLRFVNENFNFSAGVRFEPQSTKLDYQKNLLDTTVTRNIFNVSPDVRLRWNMDKFSRLELRYRGASSQPSMTDLLDVTDNSDQLNIHKGNPGLKPSWSNNFNMHYNTYQQTHQRSFAADISFNQTLNNISNAVTYDATSGVRTYRPENINGNWNTNGWFMFNTALGTDNMFFLGTDMRTGFSNSVGYISTGNTDSQKNTMKTLNLGDRLRASYRTDYLELSLNGSINYDHSRSNLQSQSNLDTYTFAYGTNIQFNTTWKMTLSTDIAMNSRRGYNDASMNTNELIWNAQLSQSFLAQNAATLSLQMFDLLHQLSNISRSINAQMRSDSWSNGINSYFMVHFIYRLNVFGGMGGRIRMSGADSDRNSDRSPGNRGGRGGGEGGGPGGGPR